MTPKPCTRCHGETELTVIDSTEGEAEPLVVAIRNLPVATCAQGHRQFVRPEFPAQLLDHLTTQDEPNLPAGDEKGLIRKHYLCEGCGAELEPKPDHRHTFSVDVALKDLDPIRVELTMPVYKCTACDKEQLHSLKEIRKRTPQALAHAFQAAEIPPG